MKKNVYILVALLCMIVGCRRNEQINEPSGLISIVPQTEQSTPSTKAGETVFLDGDQLGLYLVKSPQDLAADHNVINNALFVARDGKIEGNPAIYYPDRSANVDLYSYYPYQPGLANALGVFFGIHTDQADFSSYRASDLCYGAKRGVAPKSIAEPVTYAHKMSRVVFNLTLPASIGDKAVESVESVTLLGLVDSVTLDLSTGMTVNSSHLSDVKMYPQSQTQFAAIVPAQTLGIGHLARIMLKFDDATTTPLQFNLLSTVAVVAGATNNFPLTVTDAKTIVLDGAPTIEAWQPSDSTGVVVGPISNSFNVLWRLPHPKHSTATAAKVSLYDSKSNLTRDFATTNFTIKTDPSSEQLAVYSFDLMLPASAGVSYAYQIKDVSFLDVAGDTIQRCEAPIAANVTRSGTYTLGIEQSNILHIVSGTVTTWDEVSGNGSLGGGVANTFKLQFIEPAFDFSTLLGKVRLRIDGVDYNFDKVSSSGNTLLQNSSKFSLPDVDGKVPAVYPYVIEQIVMIKADGSELQLLDANIQVTRGGDITMQVFRGVVVLINSSVQGYGSAVDNGNVEYRGPVTSNKIDAVYCFGTAVSATSCLNVKKVRLTLGTGATVTLGDYTMRGTQFAASSSSPIDITTSASAPTNYPYTITRVEFIDGSGVVLADATPTDPIKVLSGGDVVVKIMN